MKVETQPKVDHTPAELDVSSRQLLKAAALIEEQGHWQGGVGNSSGTCALIAVMSIAGGTGYEEARDRLTLAIGGDSVSSIYRWNDSHSKDEVVAKLRAVALGL